VLLLLLVVVVVVVCARISVCVCVCVLWVRECDRTWHPNATYGTLHGPKVCVCVFVCACLRRCIFCCAHSVGCLRSYVRTRTAGRQINRTGCSSMCRSDLVVCIGCGINVARGCVVLCCVVWCCVVLCCVVLCCVVSCHVVCV